MVQDIDGRSHVVTVLVEILDGPGCEVLIDDADDIGSLAGKIGRAIAMVLDAQRRALHQCSLWADQHPLALPDPVDPAIRTVDGRPLQYVWGLPAGWVPVMNRLHADLVELLGHYEVTTVGTSCRTCGSVWTCTAGATKSPTSGRLRAIASWPRAGSR